MQSNNNLLDKQQYLRVKIAIVLVFLLLTYIFGQSSVFAHGGEDHGEEQLSAPIAKAGEIDTKLAKASTTEMFIKYPTPKVGELVNIRIFLTDLITNTPVDKAKISLDFQYLGTVQKKSALSFISNFIPVAQANSSNLVITANSTNILGMYEAKVTFPNVGQYSLQTSISGSRLDAQAFISGIVVTESTQLAQTSIFSKSVNTTITIITLGAILILVLLYLFFLATDRSKQSKVDKDIL